MRGQGAGGLWPDDLNECLVVAAVLNMRHEEGAEEFLLEMSSQEMDIVELLCCHLGLSYEKLMQEALESLYNGEGEVDEEDDQGEADWNAATRCFSITPMAFDPEPATVTLKPVAVNPTVGPQRRALVVARNPIVSVAVPSPMARDPSVSTPWWWRTGRFGYEGWRGVGSINPSFRFLRNQNKAEDQDGHQRREYRPRAG